MIDLMIDIVSESVLCSTLALNSARSFAGTSDLGIAASWLWNFRPDDRSLNSRTASCE
jgi:hypothetical protein